MFRLRSSFAGRRSPVSSNTSGDWSSKRFRSTTLAAILVLLFSPAPSMSVPLVARRSSIAASSDDFDDQSSMTSAGSENGGERVFFPSMADGSDVQSKLVVRAAIGETAVLECEAGGSPGPTIHWIRHGQRILQSSGTPSVLDDEATHEAQSPNGHRMLRLSSTKSRLYIDCVGLQDAGVYQCVAETPTKRIVSTTVLDVVAKSRHNKHRRHRGHQLSHRESQKETGSKNVASSELTSNECLQRRSDRLAHTQAARVYMWTVHRIEIEGTDVQLYCRASGSPAPKITWYDRDDNKISDDGTHYSLLPNGDLLIRDVTWTDHMGLYRCVAVNDAGSDTATTFLYPTTE